MFSVSKAEHGSNSTLKLHVMGGGGASYAYVVYAKR